MSKADGVVQMIRIKVVKASHLVLGVLVALAVVVLIALICKTMFFDASAANADVALATNTGSAMERKQPAGLFSRCLFRRKRAGGNVGIEPGDHL